MVKASPSAAGGAGSIPGRGAKIPHAAWPKNQNVKQKQYCNKFNKDFKNGPHQKKNLKKKVTLTQRGGQTGWRDKSLSQGLESPTAPSPLLRTTPYTCVVPVHTVLTHCVHLKGGAA